MDRKWMIKGKRWQKKKKETKMKYELILKWVIVKKMIINIIIYNISYSYYPKNTIKLK